MNGRRRARAWLASASALAVAVILFGFGSGATAHAASSSQPQSGGTMTVLEAAGGIGDWPQGLDPAVNSLSAEDEPMYDAIYGQLFTENAKGQPEPDLATGYEFLDGGKTVDIFLRHGVTFSDGTPFNASAVAWNIRRDLDPANACLCDTSFPVATPLSTGIATEGDYTVVLHLKEVFSPIITAFSQINPPDWIASPTAFNKMGQKAFALKPVGAGPFEVVSDNLNAELVLKKNPNYWQKGHPYLNGLTFKTIGTPEAGYEALQTGEAQAMQQVAGAISVVQTAEKNSGVRVVATPAVATSALQLNTKTAPFNNIEAREAIYYATDAEALNKVINGGEGTTGETGDGPGSLFPIPNPPGYRTYDLAKAKALVQQLGGLSFTIIGTAETAQAEEAEGAEFSAAGMKVTLNTTDTLEQEVQAFQTNSWQAIPGGAGGLDPELGAGGLAWRVLSTGPFTGVKSTYADSLVDQGTSELSSAARLQTYTKLYNYLSQQALMPFSYPTLFWNIDLPSTQGPGLSTAVANTYLIQWPDVWIGK
jgi:peptide/nickel transport system substrate-binding protein